MKTIGLFVILAIGALPLSAVRPQDNWFHDETWDKSGAGPGQLIEPYGVAIGPDGRVYVGDDGADKIVIYNPDGTFNGEIAGTFGGAESFSQPRGMIFDGAGKLHVADFGRNAVFVFNADGSFAAKLGGTSGTGDGELDGVIDVAVGPTGEIYVLENINARVSVFGSDGTFLRRLSGPGSLDGQLEGPLSIAVAPNRRVLVCHFLDPWPPTMCLKEFDENGLFVRKASTLGETGVQPGSGYWSQRGGSSVRLDVGGYPHVVIAAFIVHRHANLVVFPDEAPDIRVYDRDLEEQAEYIAAGTDAQLGHDYLFPCHAMGADGTMIACKKSTKTLYVFRNANRELPLPARNTIPISAVRKVEQRANSPIVDVDYEVMDVDDATVTTGMLVFKGGNQSLADCIRVLTLAEGTEARVGSGIATNTLHRVTWNAGADWATELSDFKVAVLAKDSRAGLLDIHYLLLPADHGMPELKVSRSPLVESDFMQVWWWLLGTQDSGISLGGGQIHGVGGAADGLLLNDNGSTTADGRAYLYDKLNVREATAAELQWAREAATEGIIEVWEPARQVGERPKMINEYGFDTGDWGAEAWWVVPLD